MPALPRAPGGALLLALLPAAALAQDAQPTTLPEMEVVGRAPGSLTVPSVAEQRKQVELTPAAARFIDAEEFQNRRAFTLRDVLADTPGVFVQERYGQELRLSVRGSGIARGFHLRGRRGAAGRHPGEPGGRVRRLLPDRPAGAAQRVAVFPGGNALAYGASTLGGAINFVTADRLYRGGAEHPPRRGRRLGHLAAVGPGLRASSATRMRWPTTPTSRPMAGGSTAAAATTSSTPMSATASPTRVETRFYAGIYGTRQQLPGSLTLGQALNTPRIANPTARSPATRRATSRPSASPTAPRSGWMSASSTSTAG